MEGIFWKGDFHGEGKGGLIYRAFDLNKFVSRIEELGDEIVGIRFDDSNVIEFITKINAEDKDEKA